MKKLRRYGIIMIAMVPLLLFIHGQIQLQTTRYNLQKLSEFTYILRLVESNWVQEVNLDTLVDFAIQGMLKSLDPHSAYLTPEGTEELTIQSKGKYGGLGIQIGIRDGWLTVIAPIEGTPAYRAGIRAGDRIIKIEGVSTKGITLQEAVKKLRGKPGTKVTITIERPGMEEPFDLTITRAIIEIKSVPYYGVLEDDIGYIRLAHFDGGAADEVRKAVNDLRSKGVRKFILDLRSNPGGLLKEAVDVADIFIGKDSLVVAVRGRNPSINRDYKAKQPGSPPWPVVVLVDRGSASASEIVSGAIQDWERGVILGDTTFGKGSVQHIFRVTGDRVLKLTTALYYTPSGRCIHRTDTLRYLLRVPTAKDTFYTLGKRHRPQVGGGGIIPDIVHDTRYVSPIVNRIMRKGLFLTFGARYASEHADLKPGFDISDDVLEEFKSELRAHDVEFADSEFVAHKDEIKLRLKMAIAETKWGNAGRYEVWLKADPWVNEAVEILKASETLDDLFEQASRY